MIDMSIPIVLGTLAAEAGVVVSSFVFSNYLHRPSQMQLEPNTGMHRQLPRKKMSYKDEKVSYFDHASTATQMKFERDTDHGSSTVRACTVVPVINSSPIDTGSLKRRGPQLPGFKNNTPLRS